MMGWLLGAGSALVALAQAGSLVRSAQGSASPLAALARIAGVGGMLWVAARSGHWALGAAGWGVGFLLACAFWQRRLQSRRLG
jgi:hypothetical protein